MKSEHRGDDGYTDLPSMGRVPKYHLLIEFLGEIDELNSYLGLAKSMCKDLKDVQQIIQQVQGDLSRICRSIAIGRSAEPNVINVTDVNRIEKLTKDYWYRYEGKFRFVTPGDDVCSSTIHIARTVCRRVERLAAKLLHDNMISKEEYVYLNRLSDLLFALAVHAAHTSKK